MPRKAKTGRAVRLGILELVLLLLGILFVRREIWEFHAATLHLEHWQVAVLIPMAAADGAVTGAFSSRTRNVEHQPAYRRTMFWGVPSFFFLYVACAALCERLSVGVFTIVPEVVRCLGLLIVAAGTVFRIW